MALAVAVSTNTEPAGQMDQEDADAFFGDLGFEYIDGDKQGSNRIDIDGADDEEEMSGWYQPDLPFFILTRTRTGEGSDN